MAASRPDALFQPKKQKKPYVQEMFQASGNVLSVCQLADKNRLAVLTNVNKYNKTSIEIFDLNLKKFIAKEDVPIDANRINRLSNEKILCSDYFNKIIFDPATNTFSKEIAEHGDFIGMLNQKEYVLKRKDGFTVVNLDEKIAPIKVTWRSYCDMGYHFQIWPDEIIAVTNIDLELYQREGDGFCCAQKIELGTHKATLSVGENLIVQYFDFGKKEKVAEAPMPMLKTFEKEEKAWQPIPGVEYKPDRSLDYGMNFRVIPGDHMFMMETFDKVAFFDSKTLKHFEFETDFGDTARYACDDYDDEENEEEPDYFHSSISVLDNGQIVFGYDGYFRLLTVQLVKELKEEKRVDISKSAMSLRA